MTHPDQPAHAWISTDPYGSLAPADAPAVPPPAPGRRTALVALVLGAVALLGVLVLGIVVVGGVLGGSGEPLRGTIATTGGAVAGGVLAREVERQARADGGDVSGVDCPDTARVAQNVTTVCHGEVSGDRWAFVVFFEDDRGTYTLLPV